MRVPPNLPVPPGAADGLNGWLQQMRTPDGGFIHRLLAVVQVVQHWGVGAGKFPAPVLTRPEQ